MFSCWVGVQVPSLVSKYIKGVWLEVWKKHRALVCVNAPTASGANACLQCRVNRNVALPLSQGASLPPCTCFRITMPVSASAKNNQTPRSIFKNSAPHTPEIKKKTAATAYANDLAGLQDLGGGGKHQFTLLDLFVHVIHTRRP